MQQPSHRRRRLLAAFLLALPVAFGAQGTPGVFVDGRGVSWRSEDGGTRVTMRFRVQELMTRSSSEHEPFSRSFAILSSRATRGICVKVNTQVPHFVRDDRQGDLTTND
jgi:hypothetical protein